RSPSSPRRIWIEKTTQRASCTFSEPRIWWRAGGIISWNSLPNCKRNKLSAKQRGEHTDQRGKQATRNARAQSQLEAVGTLPFRTAMGHGARRLQRRRERVGLF